MFTASHNPAQYNGIKLCLAGCPPGRRRHRPRRDQARSPTRVLDGGRDRARRSSPARAASSDLLDHVRRPRRVVRRPDDDPAAARRRRHRQRHGRSRRARPCSSGSPTIELEVMYGELDGTFPNHPADPLQPANQRDLQARVVSGGFDIGLAFDGDADRVFVVDETGHGLSGSTTTALLAAAVLRTDPGRHDPAQPDLLAGRARGDPRARRRAGAHQGRALVHQAGDGRDRRRVRWRALGALLLRPQLPRRQRADRVAARARRAEPRPAQTCRCCASRSSATPRAARSTPTSTTSAAVIDDVSAEYADVRAGPPRRAHRRLRLVVVQPAPVEHRAAAAPQPRGGRPATSATPTSPSCSALDHPRLNRRRNVDEHLTLDSLLEILACPEDKGPLYYFEAEDRALQPAAASGATTCATTSR